MAKRKRKTAPRRGRTQRRASRPRAARTRVPAKRAGGAMSQRAIEAALAGIAHEIRTPLTGIVALAELLASSDLGQREREWANALKSGADHLAALSTLIVDAVRVDTAGITLRKESFSPRALAEAVGQGLAARAGNKDIRTELSIATDMPALVAGDALRLRAALENLADNAVKFTQAGVVTLVTSAESAARKRMRLVFTVTDSGVGMTATELNRLFRPFAQASEQVAERFGGAGLGLVFVRRIARLMGGDLTVTSEPGRGSTFRLTALVEPVAVQPVLSEDGVPRSPARALNILCAEDNPYGRVVMNTILRELGHRVDFVATGEAAVKAAERGDYDAVLMDVMLSGLDGLAATRAIRLLPGAAGRVPVIGISGRGTAADERAARDAGMDFFFAKPVGPGRLAQALATIA